jgi:hypothetical protein
MEKQYTLHMYFTYIPTYIHTVEPKTPHAASKFYTKHIAPTISEAGLEGSHLGLAEQASPFLFKSLRGTISYWFAFSKGIHC